MVEVTNYVDHTGVTNCVVFCSVVGITTIVNKHIDIYYSISLLLFCDPAGLPAVPLVSRQSL